MLPYIILHLHLFLQTCPIITLDKFLKVQLLSQMAYKLYILTNIAKLPPKEGLPIFTDDGTYMPHTLQSYRCCQSCQSESKK